MNRPIIILDSKGLMMQMFYRGNDPDGYVLDDGKKVNTAGWGFVNWLDEYFLPIVNDYGLSNIIAVWDGGDDYRTALYPAYKKVRKEAKKKLSLQERNQLKHLETSIKVFLANMGVINVNVDGVEADDVIETICEGYRDRQKVVYTGDVDLLQLIDDLTVVYLKNARVLEDHKGIPHNLIRLNKALVGDKTDGYGGIHRFGPKAWEALEQSVGRDGLEQIDECFQTGDFNAMDIEDHKILQFIMANLKEAKLSYKLATLTGSLSYGFKGRKLTWPVYYLRVPNRSQVMNVLNQMACPQYLEKLEPYFPTETLMTMENQAEVLDHFYEGMSESPFVSFDYETVDHLKHAPFTEAMSAQSRARGDYLDVLSSEITGVSFNYGKDLQHTIYIPTQHKDTHNFDPMIIVLALEQIQDELDIPLIAHNASFEEQVTKVQLNHLLKKPYDTMILSSYVNENELSGLKFLSAEHLKYDQTSYQEVLQAAGAENMADLTGEQVLSYGCDDSLVTSHLFRLFELICRMEGQWDFYVKNERAPVHVLNDAFEKGVNIDYEEVANLHKKADKIVAEGGVTIRSILSKHCNEPDEAAAKALDTADGDNLMQIFRLSKERVSDTAVLAKRQETLLNWELAAIYTPYTQTHVLPTFLGTASQLNIVMSNFVEVPVEFKLKANSKIQISNYISERKDFLQASSVEVAEFLDLLGSAAHQLKKREGKEWDALEKFCLPHLGDGKTVSSGDELNVGSPKQMTEFLYCKLGLPLRKRTKVTRDSTRAKLGLKGSPSTDEDAMLIAIAEDCEGDNAWKAEVLETVIKVKSEKTKISLYYKGYPLWKHPRDGMVHPSVRNCGTVTRRPSGNNPNILQVEKGPTRRVYLPRYNTHVIVAMDFSGQELRITGSEAKDPTMIEAYTGGGVTIDEDGMHHPVTKDIHSVTSVSFAETIFKRELNSTDFDLSYDGFRSLLFGHDKNLSKIAAMVRGMAKIVNFLIIYGGTAQALSMKLRIPEAFAEQLMRNVFAAYDRLAPWQAETIQYAKTHGFVKTAYGTLKHLTSDIKGSDKGLSSRQERQAVNQTVQGCAADILKIVLTGSYDTNLWQETGAVMIAPVYDEVVSSVPIDKVFEYTQRMKDIMNVTPPGHPIPMMAEVCVGPNWYEAGGNELGDNPSEKKIIACIDGFRRKAA